MSLQEKFQVTVPYSKKTEEGDSWNSFDSTRVIADASELNDGHLHTDSYCAHGDSKFTHGGLAGSTDESGCCITPSSLGVGYHHCPMNGSDDQYTGENVDLFYGEAVDESGAKGFAERNNYLDRI